MRPSLSDAESDRFEREGWIGPYPLLETSVANALAPEMLRCHAATRGYFYPDEIEPGRSYYDEIPWFQSLHTLSPQIAEIGRRPEILGRVAPLLGPDLLLWAGICFEQRPNGLLHWHTDTEFDYVNGVGIWLGIEGTSPDNALKVLPGSQRFGEDPEDWITSRGESMTTLASDERMLELLGSRGGARIERVPVRDGEFIVFNGKLWHASQNPSDHRRVALGLRYSPAGQRVRTPLSYLRPVVFDPTPPPCHLVAGRDDSGVNRIVDAPSS